VALSFLYVAFVRLFQLVRLSWGERDDLAIEVVLLRHEVSVLRRQVARPVLRPRDRAVLAALSRMLTSVRRRRFFVQPETLLLWHRDLGQGRWTYQHRRSGRPALPAGPSPWCFGWRRRTRPGDIAGSMESSRPWASDSPLRASGPSCVVVVSNPRPDDQIRPGRSSSEHRPRPCWPATSLRSTRSSLDAFTCCSSSRSTPAGPPLGRHRQSNRGVGHPASPKPTFRPGRAFPTGQGSHR
jgi:hypothetical protein